MKKISELLRGVSVVEDPYAPNSKAYGITCDSRKVKNGYMFFVTDGNRKFIAESIKNGAKYIVTDDKEYIGNYLVVENIRIAMARISANYYDNPQENLKFICLVGTNGKTSTAHIIDELLSLNYKTTLIGTIGATIGDKDYPIDMTTPDPEILYEILKLSVDEGVDYVIYENSAHSIALQKTYGIVNDIGVFTNISQDHLDFFKDFSVYANTKTNYFNAKNMKKCVVNGDDEFGKTIIKNNSNRCISYGIDEPNEVFAIKIDMQKRMNFVCNVFDDILYIDTSLYGRMNVYNIMAAITVARLCGVECGTIETLLSCIKPIPGRFNIVNENPRIIIDFAHTPDGLKNVLSEARKLTNGRLIVVFGCGGNRDRLKRPIMGKIASNLSDVVILTNDNPRYEDPIDIIGEITAGVDKSKTLAVPDRSEAIRYAISLAKPGDTVCICGKGCENYIDVMGKKILYNDFETCKNFLSGRK